MCMRAALVLPATFKSETIGWSVYSDLNTSDKLESFSDAGKVHFGPHEAYILVKKVTKQ